MLAFGDSSVRFECAAHVSVLVLSQDVRYGEMADVSSIFAISTFLNKVMLTSSRDGVVALDLVRETLTGNRLELEGLDELVLGSATLTGDADVADVCATVELANDERVASDTSIVGVVVVLTIVCGLKVVTTIEELGDISAAGTLNDELATGMVGCVISAVKHEIVEEQ